MGCHPFLVVQLLLVVLHVTQGSDVATINLIGNVSTEATEFFFVPFTVPAGIVELEVAHDRRSLSNILDWGLNDTVGFRGWGGGNLENAVVGQFAASRSYLAGPIPAGEWSVVVGKAQIVVLPAMYNISVTLRDQPTLPPQKQRSPYKPVAALRPGPAWFAGDLHVHSMESGDALPTIDEIVEFSRSEHLDFVEISDHNTVSQLDFFNDVQSRSTDVLLVPGVEYTTYHGHANGIGATTYVDHKVGVNGVSISGAADHFHSQGALFSINHEDMDYGFIHDCIGCRWEYTSLMPMEKIDGMEIGIGSSHDSGMIFDAKAIKWWDQLCAGGYRLAPLGGSDDHHGGRNESFMHSKIGNPTTMVFASELSADAIVAGIKSGRTVVKLGGPEDPMIILDTVPPLPLGTSETRATVNGTLTLSIQVHGAHLLEAPELHILRNGVVVNSTRLGIHRDWSETLQVPAPASATDTDRWRAEVHEGITRRPCTITSHIYVVV